MRILPVFIITSGLLLLAGCFGRGTDVNHVAHSFTSPEQILAFFPKNGSDVRQKTAAFIQEHRVTQSKFIQDAPTLKAQEALRQFDRLQGLGDLTIWISCLHWLEAVHPEEEVRTAAHQAIQEISAYITDEISNNKQLYEAINAHKDGILANGTEQEKYVLNQILTDFERSGIHLPDEQREQIKALEKKITELCLNFDKNIADGTRTIEVEEAALVGLSEAFIAQLARTAEGLCILTTDYPHYFTVMQHCAVESTREKMFNAFENKAYPANTAVLQELIATRRAYAQALGYPSFAEYTISNQMAHSTETVQTFLQELLTRAQQKDAQEVAARTKVLPPSVTLAPGNLIKPWDNLYLSEQYKKTAFNLDTQKLTEYFPLETTLKGLLDIYEQFFSIKFVPVKITNAWHKDAQAVAVYSPDHKVLYGNLFLDLFPRPNKFSHAAHFTFSHGILNADGTRVPGAAGVVANFPPATAERPALMRWEDVRTFFHEFGHALHGLLGITPFSLYSGTQVKMDFVEMPSQMLEEWLYDKAIIQKISAHYQTKETLPEDLINALLATKNIESGAWTARQCGLALLSLELYNNFEGDMYELSSSLTKQCRPYLLVSEPSHFPASFGHLAGYSAKYYSYLWSKVFALDLFAAIEKEGLLNPVVGSRYVKEVLSKGGTQNPMEMITAFLGRPPSSDAFFKNMGFDNAQATLQSATKSADYATASAS